MPITLQQFLDRLPAEDRLVVEDRTRYIIEELRAEETLEQLPVEFRDLFKNNVPPAKLASFVKVALEKIEKYTKRIITEEYDAGYKNGYNEGYKIGLEDN